MTIITFEFTQFNHSYFKEKYILRVVDQIHSYLWRPANSVEQHIDT